MKVTIFNREYNDSITFEIEELTEDERNNILNQVHARNWKDEDCWSEVTK